MSRTASVFVSVNLDEFSDDDIRGEFEDRFGEPKPRSAKTLVSLEEDEVIEKLKRLREFLLVQHVDAVALEATRTALRNILGTAL